MWRKWYDYSARVVDVTGSDHAAAKKTEIHFENRSKGVAAMCDNIVDVYAEFKFC